MSDLNAKNFPSHFKLVPFLIGTGLSVALCVGILVFFNPFGSKGTRTPSTTTDRELVTQHLGTPTDDSERNESNQGLRMSSNLASIFELPTYFESSLALDNLLKRANLQTLEDLLDQSHNLQGIERRQSAQVQIFRKFATLDPKKALSRAQSFPKIQYTQFASLIYREWVLIDLDDALTFAEQHVPTLSWEVESAVLEQIFRAAWDFSDDAKLQIAERLQVNPYTSAALLRQIESDKPLDNPTEAWHSVLRDENFWEDQADLLLLIAQAVIEKDGYSKFAELTNSIQDRRTRTRLINIALSDRLDTDEMGTVFEQAVHLFHESARPVLFNLASWWCYSDPLGALNAMSRVPSDSLRKSLEESVIDNWVSGRPMEVVEQLDALPVEYREIAFSEGIWSMSARHPKETTEYLDKISDPRKKWNIMRNLLQNWAYSDIEEAFAWFLDNPDMEIPMGQSRDTLLRSLSFGVNAENAPSLIERALEDPVDESGSGWEGSIVGFLAHQDIAKAKELLPQVRDGPGRLNTYVAIGLAIFYQEQSIDSVIKLTEEIPDEDHDDFFGIFLPRLSPQVAYQQIDALPTPEAQARASLGLLQRAAKSANNPFTDEQIEHLESFLTESQRTVLELNSPSTQQ